ncbi:TetR family transcriptional regulator [Enemella dayhoffiae]|uniref:TetR family transcriptional regulator n=1 Tax=Enemella dayhoffiae TaxID=2016507 RepID=A0A255GRW7_9ACTN|nr:TetR/AcrR family transcriptional regulator [Enemella dayhoffiae]OYO18555.1 TetR family transcriptional regulator [Enemella dayhoffiae]
MPSNRGRPPGFDRSAVLREAMLAFWRHGYQGVSIADLTTLTGLQASSLYAAFGSKQELFELAVDCYAKEFGSYVTSALADQPTAYRAVRQLLREAARTQSLPGLPHGCLIIQGATNTPPRSTDVVESLARRRRMTVTLIQQRIDADIDAGKLPTETDARNLAEYVVAVQQGMAQRARDGADTETLEAIADAAMLAWPSKVP